MAQAIITQDGDGGIKLVVPAWDDLAFYAINADEMLFLIESHYGVNGDPDEDGYTMLCEAVTDKIVREAGTPATPKEYGELWAAVTEALCPGGPILTPRRFTV